MDDVNDGEAVAFWPPDGDCPIARGEERGLKIVVVVAGGLVVVVVVVFLPTSVVAANGVVFVVAFAVVSGRGVVVALARAASTVVRTGFEFKLFTGEIVALLELVQTGNGNSVVLICGFAGGHSGELSRTITSSVTVGAT